MSNLGPEEEPDGAVLAPHHFYIGVAVSVFGFMFVWAGGLYPKTAAIMTVVGLLIALDDALSHALGVSTPLDQLWKRVIYPLVRRFEKR